MPQNSEPNKYGLLRSALTEGRKREVRQRVGFGCVICGKLPIQYHHFDPPFAEATEHNSNGITLLCGYCHDMVTRGIWSDNKVKKWNTKPKNLTASPRHLLDIEFPVNLLLGAILFRGNAGPWLSIGGIPLISIRLNEDGEPLLTANFFDDAARPAITVTDNELQFRAPNWDITVAGGTITVWKKSRDIVFEAVTRPPHLLYIKKIRLSHCGWTFASDSSGKIHLSHNGRSSLDFGTNNICLFGGHLSMAPDGGFVATGGTTFGPYPAERLRQLAIQGQIDQILAELLQPTLYVTPARTERKAPWRVDPAVGLDAQLIYPLLCEICNEVQCGTSDRPKDPRTNTGIMCESCANSPFDSWKVMFGRGEELGRFSEKRDAVAVAIETMKRDMSLRIVIHGVSGDRHKFIFADKTY